MSVQTVGRYEVIGELGRGAMGVVYKAQDPTIGRVVAMKTMRLDTHGLETEDMLRRFKNEARAAGVLSHPNIVTIYDAGEQDGMFYIAMEYIEGTTLHSVLAEHHVLPVEEAIRVTREICKGLDYAHAHGIIHRDIKPANIMITAKGAVKIMDFGIAKAGGGMTSTGQVLGTPNYMSPEQVKGKPLDGRSDLFSFGVILYEMITGEKPFIGQNVTTIIYKIVHENPIAPRDLDVTIHPGLSAVVTKALAKDPSERYQSGAELVRDLENYKSIGSTQSPTAVLTASSLRQVERTQSLAGSAPANGAPRGTTSRPVSPAPTRSVTSSAVQALTSKKIRILEMVAVAAVILLAVVGGYVYYGLRTARKLHEADVELERKIQDEQIRQAAAEAALRAAANAVPDTPPATADGNSADSTDKSSANATRLRSATPVPPLPAMLAISSLPAGARITIDGQDTGKATPAQITVDKGNHVIVLSKPGFKDETILDTVAQGQQVNYSPALQPLPSIAMQEHRPALWRRTFGISEPIEPGKGVVHLRTAPEGATIQVGDRVAAIKTPARWPAPPGIYEITLKIDGYKAVTRTVRVQEGRATDVDEILQKQQ